MSSASGPPRKRARPAPALVADDGGLGGLYDFLPAPDPKKDQEAKSAAENRTKKRSKLPEEDKTRVIFLDIDGVLLAAGSVETIFIDGVALPVRDKMALSDFSSTALANVRKIIERTGAGVVLSSEWRRTESMRNSIGGILRDAEIPPLRDITPILQPRPDLNPKNVDQAIIWAERRAREITKFLKEHKDITSWVALDDLDFNWADSVRQVGTNVMKCHSVVTNAQKCLLDEDAEKAVHILLEPPNLSEMDILRAQDEAVRATNEALASTKDGKLM